MGNAQNSDSYIDILNSVAVSLQANYTDRATAEAGEAYADFCW
jgi:hypothetical protein